MTIIMTKQIGKFLLEGMIDNSTALSFQNYFEDVLNTCEELVVDVENVSQIDSSGMKALKSLYLYAKGCNRKFYVVGTGCKEIYDHFRLTQVA